MTALLLLLTLSPPPSLAEFCLKNWAKDPEVEIEDAYKWLFHATRGGEHAISSEAGPRGWMEREWPSLGPPLRGEPLWVPLRPDGGLGRLNLRPYRARGGEKEAILRAFLDSAKGFKSDPKDFVAVWDEIGRRLQNGPAGKLTIQEWKRLDGETRPTGFPAIGHSQSYEKLRKPAYRVLRRSEFMALSKNLRPQPAGNVNSGNP